MRPMVRPAFGLDALPPYIRPTPRPGKRVRSHNVGGRTCNLQTCNIIYERVRHTDYKKTGKENRKEEYSVRNTD